MPNTLLAFGKPEDVKAHCRKLIETIGAEGGYIMDASAIMQNDATIENLRAMTDATLEYGVYRSASSPSPIPPPPPPPPWRPSPLGGAPPPPLCFLSRKVENIPPPLPFAPPAGLRDSFSFALFSSSLI